MMKRSGKTPAVLPILSLAVTAGWFVVAPVAQSAETQLLNSATPWRTYLVNGANIVREQGDLKLALFRQKPVPFDPASPEMTRHFHYPPSADWIKIDFDDHCWSRYAQDDLVDLFGGHGSPVSGALWPAMFCLRSSFGVTDPAQVKGLKLAVTCLGGAVVYVNGQEAGRKFLPAGTLTPFTPADDYPIEAYTTEDGKTPLPDMTPAKPSTRDVGAWSARYQRRIRTFTMEIPPRLLVKGRNVIAIELHRAATNGPLLQSRGWSHLGVRSITLTSSDSAGLIPYGEAVKGTHLWSANAEDQITDTPAISLQSKRTGFKTLLWSRGLPIKGTQLANPFDPISPVRMVVPRNGVGSGHVVLSDLEGLKGITATMGALKGPGGAIIPATAVTIRYAVQPANQHYCDALMPTPPATAKTLPVWTIVEVPKDQMPGWYVGSLGLAANGRTFSTAVQVLVTGYTLPDSKNFTSDMGVTQSPDAIAQHYKVEPWSDAHFRLLEPSLSMMGQLGNDVLQVPIITRNQFNWKAAMIRFTRKGDELIPDFTILERYLDLYTKYCAPPKALCLNIWDQNIAKRMTVSYEGNQQTDVVNTKAKDPLMVALWDPQGKQVAEVEAPHIGEPGSEQFYKRLGDGVKAIVLRRGWSERCILLGMGGDRRLCKEHAALMKEWLPYARWDLLSHFSGDPGALFNKKGAENELLKSTGKLIAVGGLEVGMKEHPWSGGWTGWTALQFEDRMAHPLDFMDLGTYRWLWQEYSPPFVYRPIPQAWAALGRAGLDFWDLGAGRQQARNSSYFTAINAMTAPGPAGAVPTHRFQMMREGVQDTEVRLFIIRSYAKLSEEQRKSYRALLDELPKRIGIGSEFLSQSELSYDYPAYVARVQTAAAELAGVKGDARWEAPPR